MPTIIYLFGWRLFFFANEGNEPIHIHGEKGEKLCKYWLDVENTDIKEAYIKNMNSKDIREVKKIIFEYFDLIVSEWTEWEVKRNA
jgi:Domain of unknown function (DUF4160)